ncbi:hypothetical protein BH11VER1_BH11VER1_02280 [soil metagenome]
MEFFLSALAMVLIAGIFVSFIVVCGTLQAAEEAEKREKIRAYARESQKNSASKDDLKPL